MLELPGHTTHRLQPLYVSFFKPMENYFSQAIESYLRTSPRSIGIAIPHDNLINEAYLKTFSIITIANGFRKAGIWPVNRMVFNEGGFIAADALLEGNEDRPTAPETFELINHDHTPEEVTELRQLCQLKKFFLFQNTIDPEKDASFLSLR
ncbi:hypothetical protein ILUMI_27068 [Ignelater luminosus]|uniref:Uncharacterized protein n=1 Tax=Ignelater luminosus TaxID=2038154 RepID=A0A8K0FYI8_IGNLU|nr:hypothetical protein ILUMI_27068 [Ignelater luminosus]